MRKPLAAVFALCLSSSALAQAQTPTPEPITLRDLKTPVSPGFELLGVAPTDIDRPATPRAFAVSLLSALQRGDTVLPDGFAMEVAPYWLVPHDRLEFKTYINPNVAQSIRQTFSISVASTKAVTPPIDAIAKLMDVGVGFRTSPWSGMATPEVEKLRVAIVTAAAQASVIDALLDQITPALGTVPSNLATAIARLRAGPHLNLSNDWFDQLTRTLQIALGANGDATIVHDTLMKMRIDGDATRKKAALELQRANQKRTGFTMDLAGAFVTRTTDAQGSGARLTREGVWVTTGYSNAELSFLGLARYVGNSEEASSKTHLFDSGFRFSGTTGDLTASLEAIYRRDLSSVRVLTTASKVVAIFEYKVSEDITLTSTFGKDFDDTHFGRNGSMISILGVSFGLGGRPAVSTTDK
jgi:hypothetical protein